MTIYSQESTWPDFLFPQHCHACLRRNTFKLSHCWKVCKFYIQYNQPDALLHYIKSIGDCLLDVPESAILLPKELPGTKYSLDQQCQQIFGEEFVHCPNGSDSDICSQLWCQEDGTLQCSTRNGSLPWADGTPCSFNRTCLHGVCMSTQEVMQPLVR